MKPDDVLEYL